MMLLELKQQAKQKKNSKANYKCTKQNLLITYKKTANIVGKFSNSRLVTFSSLVKHFCCEHNVCRFEVGNYT